ncbi:MAG TPA: hypothetical protein VFE57_13265 [Cyclobacteriaceae bacterium]|nr:hypothetical protein [Cyclobacteriaceae bacterium]
MNEKVGTQKGEISIELVIQNIKSARDQSLSRLQKDSVLQRFLEEHYAIFGLSTIRTEFLKRDLKELRDSSLDLVHYSSLIKELKEGNVLVVDQNHKLILSELKAIFEKIRG